MAPQTKGLSPSDRIAVPLLLGLSILIFCLMLMLSWQCWADVLIDFGRELYIPWQLSQGKMLYRDIFYLYGPLAAYWHAFLFLCFGVQARTVICFNVILLGGLVWLIYRLVSVMSCRLTAAFAIFAFVSLFALSHYSLIGNYNYITPYSHALVLGLILAMAFFVLWAGYGREPTSGCVFFMGLIAGLTLLTKLELAVALWVGGGIVCSVWYLFLPGKSWDWRKPACFILGVSFPVAFFFVMFGMQWGPRQACSALLYPVTASLNPGIISNPFVVAMSGLDNVAANLRHLGLVALVYAAVMIVTICAALGIRLIRNEIGRRLGRLLCLLFFLAIFVVGAKKINWNDVFLPLPLVCLFFSGTSFLLFLRRRIDAPVAALRVAFSLFALILLGKILFKAHIFHYGFVLALPAFLVMLMFFLHDLPALLPERRFDTRTIQVVMGGVLVFLVCIHVGFSLRLYQLKTFLVSTDTGRFFTYDSSVSSMGPVLGDTITYLKGAIRRGETLVVIPEGVLLNFLLQSVNPTPYYDFIPTTINLVSEAGILESLKKMPPDYVVLLERDMSEYGARYFGRDYAFSISEWVRLHYKPVFRSGAPPMSGRGFGAVVLRKME